MALLAMRNPLNQVNYSDQAEIDLLLMQVRAEAGLNPFSQVNCSDKKRTMYVSAVTSCLNPFNQVNCSDSYHYEGSIGS